MINKLKNQSIIQSLQSLWCYINRRRKIQIFLLIILMIIASISEVISIGIVLPFLAAISAPEYLFNHDLMQNFIPFFGISSPGGLVKPLSIFLGIAALLTATLRICLLWGQTKLSYAIGADLGIKIFRNSLYQNYLYHCKTNSSEIISGISAKSNNIITLIIFPCISLLSSAIFLILIMTALIAVNPIGSAFSLLSFGGFYVLIIYFSRIQLSTHSRIIAKESNTVIRSLQEGLGGIRDILIGGYQEHYCEIYRRADRQLRKAQANSQIISTSPRFLLEAFGIILICGLTIFFSTGTNSFGSILPLLGMLALGAQRMLPILQQAYVGWASIKIGEESLRDSLELLSKEKDQDNDKKTYSIPFCDFISLSNISFRYSSDEPMVLDNISLKINKGDRVGIIGASGSGKSTLVDILMSLIKPTEGQISIDGKKITSQNYRRWQLHIAHVPQKIFLSDSTILENIAFGVPRDEIDIEKVKIVAKKAQLAEAIERMPKKFETVVGEGGIRISGGQSQRIGIARALYKNADVIIFDEATSALDYKTEKRLISTIDALEKNLTLIIVSHRLSTIKICNKVFMVENKALKDKKKSNK